MKMILNCSNGNKFPEETVTFVEDVSVQEQPMGDPEMGGVFVCSDTTCP